VLVIGGGMVGLTLASALAGAGLEVIVVDRARPESMTDAAFDGRTSAIAYGTQRMLAGLGLWPRLADAAQAILEIRVSDHGSWLFLHYDHRDMGPRPVGYIVENRDIRRALLAHLATLPAARVIAPARVVAVDRDGPGVEARLEDGRVITAALAVAADGRGSLTRRAAGIRVAGWSYPQTGIVCTIAHERPHNGIAHEHFMPAGPFAVLPMTGDRSSLVWTERTALAPAMLALDDDDFIAEIARRFGDSLGRLEVVGRRWSYPLSLMHAERYVARRLALIGDAAHVIHPIAGQGLNLGLRDVASLAEVVVDAHRLGLDIAQAPVLERYERWRRFDNLVVIAATDGLNRLFSNSLPPVRLARDLGLAAVNRLAPLKRFFMRYAMGLVGDLPRLLRGEPL
jgi:2-octaprenyl-6-methoxyphenol hydroxylase